MGYQVDQSGKIEHTNKNTILCLANGSWDAVIVKAKTKRQIQEIFRRNGQIRNYVLFTFSIILATLLKRNSKIGQVLVDTEYMGKDAIIKNITLELINNLKLIPDIHFGFVGKLSPAHDKAAKIAHNKLKARHEISPLEILKALKKTEVGRQLKDT
jgi:hypothetical protein